MKDLICKDLIVKDNIKDEFYIYFTEPRMVRGIFPSSFGYFLDNQEIKLKKSNLEIGSIIDYIVNCKHIPKRYHPLKEIIKKQKVFYVNYEKMVKGKVKKREMIRAKDGKIMSVYKNTNKTYFYFLGCCKHFFKEKDAKKFMKVKTYKNFSISCDEYELGGYKFKEAIVSLMIQKELNKDIISFFKSLIEHDIGLKFDDYIDKWAKRLLQTEQ